MEAIKIEGMNRELSPPEGWDAEKHGECTPLPVFAEVKDGSVVLTSAWKPNQEELAHLAAGASVACVVYGSVHPPIALGVFPTPHDLYADGDADLPADIVDSNGQVTLGLCKRCGKGEGDLALPCAPLATITVLDGIHGEVAVSKVFPGDVIAKVYEVPQPGAEVKGLPAAETNALPEHVRKYIMWLETDADPAGTIRENFRLNEENAALRILTKHWSFVEQAFDGSTTGRSERILDELGLPTDDAHMPLGYLIDRHLENKP